MKKNTSLLTPIITLKGGGGARIESHRRERERWCETWTIVQTDCKCPWVSQLKTTYWLANRQLLLPTAWREARLPQLSSVSLQKLNLHQKFCLLIKNVCCERQGLLGELWKQYKVFACLLPALVPPATASGDGSFPCSEERERQLSSSTSSCYLLPVRDRIQMKFLLPSICFQQDLHCQWEGTVLH